MSDEPRSLADRIKAWRENNITGQKRPPIAIDLLIEAEEELRQLRTDLAEYRRLQAGCTTCAAGKHERVLIDKNGCSVGDRPKQWGHSLDDYHWFCAHDGAIHENERIMAEVGTLRAERDQLHREIESLATAAGVNDGAESPTAKLCAMVYVIVERNGLRAGLAGLRAELAEAQRERDEARALLRQAHDAMTGGIGFVPHYPATFCWRSWLEEIERIDREATSDE